MKLKGEQIKYEKSQKSPPQISGASYDSLQCAHRDQSYCTTPKGKN